jgi:hypothetical protein
MRISILISFFLFITFNYVSPAGDSNRMVRGAKRSRQNFSREGFGEGSGEGNFNNQINNTFIHLGTSTDQNLNKNGSSSTKRNVRARKLGNSSIENEKQINNYFLYDDTLKQIDDITFNRMLLFINSDFRSKLNIKFNLK